MFWKPPGLVNLPASYTVFRLTSTVSSSLSTSRCLGQIPTTTGGYQILPFRLSLVTARSGMLKLRCALAEIIICILFWYLGARAQGCRQGCVRVRCRNAPRFVIRMQTNTSKTSVFLSVRSVEDHGLFLEYKHRNWKLLCHLPFASSSIRSSISRTVDPSG